MTYYLGMHITRDRKNKTIFINQPKSIDSLIVDYSLDISANSCPITPMRVDYSNRKSNNELHVGLDTLLSPQLITEFQSRVGASSYIAMQSRPDILFAVNTLARKTKSPNQEDMEAINRVLYYLVGTRDLGLCFRSGEGIKFYATVDASYVSHDDLRSHTGCTLHISRNSASFQSLTKKQTHLADSSTVSEYIAAHLAAKEIMWV